jgi:His-Xaa-Ser system radical SAM maturase HxsC
MKLWGCLDNGWDRDSFVARVTENASMNTEARAQHVLLGSPADGEEFALHLLRPADGAAGSASGVPTSMLDPSMCALGEGDVLRIRPRERDVQVLFRRQSQHNFFVPTTRCNVACAMCSQPFVGDDPRMFDDLMSAVPLLDPSVECLGISGGEPTLLGPRLVRLVGALRAQLPNTLFDILSNAVLLRYFRFAADLADAGLPHLRIGVPIHSDLPAEHDRIAGRNGAFDHTVLGLLNLQRCKVPVEIRVVVQRANVERLVALARFISANLCFASHVAFMGLECAGRAVARWNDVWIDPAEFRPALRQAVDVLARVGMNVSIYNLPLCALDQAAWPYARQSISDWKNEFPAECASCDVRSRCAGFFATNAPRHRMFGPQRA